LGFAIDERTTAVSAVATVAAMLPGEGEVARDLAPPKQTEAEWPFFLQFAHFRVAFLSHS
jgi:hypothetical protein